MRLLSILLLAIGWVSAEPILGVVLEEGSDRPIPYAELSYVSGKSIGQTDRRGRFELQVERRNAILLVSRVGYDTTRIELQDYGDLLDMVITMRSSVQQLAQTTVRAKVTPKWRAEREVSVAQLEDAAGMRFDVAEHLSQLPGVSGQRDFSSELSYDGSRPEEVAYHLGSLQIPNMRHLDVGLPGNLSVINPHVLKSVNVYDHYGSGPAEQGLASSIQFVPDPGNLDEFKFRGAAGTTVREVYATGPWLFWDAFTFSGRWLDPSMLKNMGEKFFTEFRKRDDACVDCNVASSDPFDLSSFDVYTHLSGHDTLGAKWSLTALLSRDEYEIRQDTSQILSSVNSAILLKGQQAYSLVGAEYQNAQGGSWHVGWVLEQLEDTLRDTLGFRSSGYSEDRNFIDKTKRNHARYMVGGDALLTRSILGAEAAWNVEYERHQAERMWYDFQKGDATLGDNFGSASGRLTWRPQGSQVILAGGVASNVSSTRPLASIEYQRRIPSVDGLRILSGGAWRSQYQIVPRTNDITSILAQGASAKLGLGLDRRTIKADVHGFARYYPSPELPDPLAFWYYRDLSKADFAWVSGMSGTVEWRTLHHFSVQSNISSVYGEYSLPSNSTLEWPANVRLETSTHLRIYPRKDSLLSMIISHRAAWHRPLYAYNVLLSTSRDSVGSRSIRPYNQYTDLFRTDLRMNLDLRSAWKPLDNVRFYVEADNVFSALDVASLRWLGADNARARSVVVVDADGNSDNGVNVVPFLAKGMGLYIQFGFESTLGF